MSQRVNEFFLAFEEAKELPDPTAICNFYAGTFMFGGVNGIQAIKREEFLKVIPKLKAHLSSLGLIASQLVSIEVNQINTRFVLAKVHWRMKIHRSEGDMHLDALATYVLLQDENETLSIAFQIDHQDLATLIKDLPV